MNLDEQTVCNPDLGCGLVAGWGPSGEGGRPRFGWFFGGDAAINSLAMSALGFRQPVAEALRFLAKYQREDGKITHEIAQSAGRIPWFKEFPYTYYHADTTPFWMVAVWRYWRASGDTTLLGELWPAVRKAYAFCLGHDRDGDGIMEDTTAGLGAIEVGAIGEDIHQDIYLAAVWTEALRAMEELSRARGETGLAHEAGQRFAKAHRSLDERYWIEAAGHHAFGILKSGRTNDTLTVWPATAAAFGLLDPARADRTLQQLGGPAITTQWGARMLSRGSPLYDPTHYNMGAVWPFVTGFLALGHYQYGRPWAGYPLIDALGQMAFDFAHGRHPELLSGAYYRPLDEAVPQQFFATSMLVTPILTGLLGWEPDGAARRARLAPQLPPQWDNLRAGPLRVGESTLTVRFTQSPGALITRVEGAGPPLSLRLALPVPVGAAVTGLKVDGLAQPFHPVRGIHDTRVELNLDVFGSERVVEVAWEGGLSVEPPRFDLEPGQSDVGIRILDFRKAEDGWLLRVEGTPGHSYELRFHGRRPVAAEGGELGGSVADVFPLRLRLPEGTAAVTSTTATVRLLE